MKQALLSLCELWVVVLLGHGYWMAWPKSGQLTIVAVGVIAGILGVVRLIQRSGLLNIDDDAL